MLHLESINTANELLKTSIYLQCISAMLLIPDSVYRMYLE